MTIRIIAGLLLVAVLALQYRLWISPNGMRYVWRTDEAIAAQTQENARLAERNRTLAAEVRDLKEGRAAIEECARTDLGMIGSERNDLPGRSPGAGSGACADPGAATDRTGRSAVTMTVRRWAVVPAAGRGVRFGGRTPKQYLPLLGRPVISWSVGALLASPAIEAVVVAIAADDRRWLVLRNWVKLKT